MNTTAAINAANKSLTLEQINYRDSKHAAKGMNGARSAKRLAARSARRLAAAIIAEELDAID